MPNLANVPQLTRNMLLMRAVEVNHDSVWTPLAKPLRSSTVALVTSAGVHLREDEPFAINDPGYRAIPSGASQGDLVQSHSSLGFDRSAAMQDLNVTFPIDRVRELADEGVIGKLAPRYYSFMGAQRDVGEIKARTSLEVGSRLREDGVDVVVLTPT